MISGWDRRLARSLFVAGGIAALAVLGAGCGSNSPTTGAPAAVKAKGTTGASEPPRVETSTSKVPRAESQPTSEAFGAEPSPRKRRSLISSRSESAESSRSETPGAAAAIPKVTAPERPRTAESVTTTEAPAEPLPHASAPE